MNNNGDEQGPSPAPRGPTEAPTSPNPSAAATFDSGIGRAFVQPIGIGVIAVALASFTLLAIYCLIEAWPRAAINSPIRLFGQPLNIDRDQQLFVIVGVSGALGGSIHSLRSLYWYAGNRVLRRSWTLMYFFLPLVGSALAMVFYVILRGGLLTGEATASQVNVYGFAATSTLVGLFSPEAAEKLQQIFSTLLAPAPNGRDRVEPGTRAVVDQVEPRDVASGAVLVLRGRNLIGTVAVLFHGASAQPDHVDEREVSVTVPLGATTGHVRLVVGDEITSAPGILHIHI
jgi:hypothetical protein